MATPRAGALPPGVVPYGWALRQIRAPRAHRTTQGSPDVVVAVIDLGYRHHADLEGHLWTDHRGRHGWDFVDDDASLEYTGCQADTSAYYRGHHVFVAGEVAAVAPRCPIMLVRVGYGRPDSWWRGIRYAVEAGARVLVVPHGYLPGERATGTPLFYQGTDFAYPEDNPPLREALEYAWTNGCLIVRGTADNRGRRAAFAMSAIDAAMAVGSSNRRARPADICCSAAYVEVGAPGGQRYPGRPLDAVWGCDGDGGYMAFTGGCMASGFAAGVAALVWSRFAQLSNAALRQVLRNTARPAAGAALDDDGWEPHLGYGIVDAARAVELAADRLCRDVRLLPGSVQLRRTRGRWVLRARLRNHGAIDAERAMVVAYDGDPTRPADRRGSLDAPAAALQTRQLGHAVARVRGLHPSEATIDLKAPHPGAAWFESYCLDCGGGSRVHRTRARADHGPRGPVPESRGGPG